MNDDWKDDLREYEIVNDENGEKNTIRNEETQYTEYKTVSNKRKRTFRGSLLSYIAVILIASLIGGLASSFIAPTLFAETTNPTGVYASPVVNINSTDDINTIAAVAKKAMSSVVGITTVGVQQDFFGTRDVPGVGSGIIVNSNGYILTNSHVVNDGNSKSIEVLFENGEKLEGKTLWNDSVLDLAIVKVETTGLPTATLGDSSNLQVGEIAVAIGNPLGLEFQRTVTSGIISGLHRSIQIDANTIIEDLIQTDASINGGNSGGPLLNGNGDVIGINTAKIKSAEGLGFAIPIDSAKVIIEEVIKTGNFETVFMGISGVGVGEYQARLGVELLQDSGVILIQVGADTPADKAGLVNGDIIIAIDETNIENMNGLKKTLYNYKVGDRANLKVLRNEREMDIQIEFEKRQ
ncbi:MAG: trypsin-like serine protease [Tissierellia bacterium]|nr:trypsin-like serine protease [Tissierellia bacterium]